MTKRVLFIFFMETGSAESQNIWHERLQQVCKIIVSHTVQARRICWEEPVRQQSQQQISGSATNSKSRQIGGDIW